MARRVAASDRDDARRKSSASSIHQGPKRGVSLCVPERYALPSDTESTALDGPTSSHDELPDRFRLEFEGRTLLGVYRVDRQLDSGGTMTVYLAENASLGVQVVVKVPHVRFLVESGFRELFAREVGNLVRLRHGHIVKVLALGEHEGVPYFVLDHLDGGTLEDRLREDGARQQTPFEVLAWLRPIADALDFLHAEGVVHRGVEPASILFDQQGEAVLSEVEIVSALGTQDTAPPLVGTPVYMAPEQAMGGDLTGAVDQYALAATVYEALAARPPFAADVPMAILVRKQQGPPTDLRLVAPHVPEAASMAVMRALSVAPNLRYASCGGFVETFESGLADAALVAHEDEEQVLEAAPPARPIRKRASTRPRRGRTSTASRAGSYLSETPIEEPARRGLDRRALLVLVSLCVTAAAGGVYLLVGNQPELPPAPVAHDRPDGASRPAVSPEDEEQRRLEAVRRRNEAAEAWLSEFVTEHTPTTVFRPVDPLPGKEIAKLLRKFLEEYGGTAPAEAILGGREGEPFESFRTILRSHALEYADVDAIYTALDARVDALLEGGHYAEALALCASELQKQRLLLAPHLYAELSHGVDERVEEMRTEAETGG